MKYEKIEIEHTFKETIMENKVKIKFDIICFFSVVLIMFFLGYSSNKYTNFIVALIGIIFIEFFNLDSIISTVYYIKIDDSYLYIKYEFKKFIISIKDVIYVNKSIDTKRKRETLK